MVALVTLCVLAAFFYSHSGNAQINPMQTVGNVMLCFNNKLIYRGCNKKEYQLDESGHLEIPCEGTHRFCNGPCLSESKALLKCINKVASNFRFNSGATTNIILNVLDNGCNGYINQRGALFEGNDFNHPSGSCGLNLSGSPPELPIQSIITIILLLAGCCLLLFKPVI